MHQPCAGREKSRPGGQVVQGRAREKAEGKARKARRVRERQRRVGETPRGRSGKAMEARPWNLTSLDPERI